MQWLIRLRLGVAVLVALALAADLPATPLSAQGPGANAPAPAQATTLYLPLVLKRANQVETGIQVQNLSGSQADLTLTYYDRDGVTRPEWTERASAAANDSWSFYTPSSPNLPPGFEGSAVLQATQSVGAIVNQQTQPDARPFYLGTYVAPRQGANTVYVPFALKGVDGRNSTITVQNTSAQASSVDARFVDRDSGLVGRVQIFLPPFAARQIRLADRSDLPATMNAAATLVADQPIVAIGDVVDTTAGNNILELYTGVSTGANSQLAPLVFSDRNGWDSEIRIQNASNAPVTVRVSVQPTGGGTQITSPAVSIAPNAPYSFRPRDVAQIGGNFVGSASVDASGNVVAIVTEVNQGRGTGMAYNAFGPTAGTPRISVPLIFKDRNSFDTGIQIQNVDNTDAQVRVTYRLSTGAQVIDFGVVPANGSYTFYQPDNAQIPAGSVGSATIENIAGQQRLVAIVNEVNYARGGDASATYEGLNY
jgi:hypothetical protein